MVAIIEIKSLTKLYGQRAAVKDLNLNVEKGEIFGFVGPNGAGKTTTLRMMAGLLKPTSGEIQLNGQIVSKANGNIKQMMGYMPDLFGVYPDLKVWEYLDFFCACYFIPDVERTGLINGLLELVELKHRYHDSVESLSRGMKQRLSLARALIHDPQILILDEPAAGLDPRARIEIRQLIIELADMGKTIFFSTHILSDVAEICTRVGIIEAGELVALGTLEELHFHAIPFRQIEITLLDKIEQAVRLVESLPDVIRVQIKSAESHQNTNYRIQVDLNGDDILVSQILSKLVGSDISVLSFSENTRNIEEVFLRRTKGLVT